MSTPAINPAIPSNAVSNQTNPLPGDLLAINDMISNAESMLKNYPFGSIQCQQLSAYIDALQPVGQMVFNAISAGQTSLTNAQKFSLAPAMHTMFELTANAGTYIQPLCAAASAELQAMVDQ